MAVQTLPVEVELVIYAGTTFRRQFRWLPDGETGQDFTGWSGRFLLGPARGVALRQLSTDDTGMTMDADGLITVELSADDTDLPAGVLFYVLDLTDPDGVVTRLLRGRCSVVIDVEPMP